VRDSISQLSELARRFDLTYDAYNEFQRGMERYWCLRYLVQEGISQYRGTMIRDELVRSDTLPLIVRLDRNPELPPKTPVTVMVGELDYWEISGRFTLAEAVVEPPQAG
jgi:exoribonuclease-2